MFIYEHKWERERREKREKENNSNWRGKRERESEFLSHRPMRLINSLCNVDAYIRACDDAKRGSWANTCCLSSCILSTTLIWSVHHALYKTKKQKMKSGCDTNSVKWCPLLMIAWNFDWLKYDQWETRERTNIFQRTIDRSSHTNGRRCSALNYPPCWYFNLENFLIIITFFLIIEISHNIRFVILLSSLVKFFHSFCDVFSSPSFLRTGNVYWKPMRMDLSNEWMKICSLSSPFAIDVRVCFFFYAWIRSIHHVNTMCALYRLFFQVLILPWHAILDMKYTTITLEWISFPNHRKINSILVVTHYFSHWLEHFSVHFQRARCASINV